MWPFKRSKITNEQILVFLQQEFGNLAKREQGMQQTLDALLKKYKCIICGVEFARLPHESDKRCPACQREIKDTKGIVNGNAGHRGPGHNTRGIHKGPKV